MITCAISEDVRFDMRYYKSMPTEKRNENEKVFRYRDRSQTETAASCRRPCCHQTRRPKAKRQKKTAGNKTTRHLERARRLLLRHVAVLMKTVFGLPVLLQLDAEVHVLEHDRLVRRLPCLVTPAETKTKNEKKSTQEKES